jgi:hypothetical protein
VPFSNNGPLSNIAHIAGTAPVTVLTDGNYLITYNVILLTGVGPIIAIAVNGVVDLSTSVVALSDQGQVSGQAILPITAGSTITLRNNSSSIPFNLQFGPHVGAQLTIERLD